jgi:hypothetical protein
VKRINLDNRVAKNAARAGAHLKEGFEVGGGGDGMWLGRRGGR